MLIPYNTDAPLYYPPFATVATIVLNIILFVPIFPQDDPYGLYDDSDFVAVDEEIPGLEEFPDLANMPDDLAELPTDGKEPLQVDQEPQREFPTISGKTNIWRLMTIEYGKFRPWQWLTANYLHIDTFHLLGNMFVLWGFGLVVEGKVGWWRFLLIYNLIGVLGCACIQLLMLFAGEGVGLGASLAIFGILAVALVWAPSNEMECLFIFGFRVGMFEASILSIATLALFLQLAVSVFHVLTMSGLGIGIRITGEIAHLIGAVFGFAIGAIMVKKNLVDCENWDIFSVWAGKNIKTSQEDREEVAGALEKIKQQEKRKLALKEGNVVPGRLGVGNSSAAPDDMVAQFRQHVTAGNGAEAWATLQRGETQILGWQIPEPDFVQLIAVLRKQQQWDFAATVMYEYLNRYTERELTIRLALAHVLVQALNRPKDALKVLGAVNDALIEPAHKATYDKLQLVARQRLREARKPPSQI